MKIDRGMFLAGVRARMHRGRLSLLQTASYEAILDAAAAEGVSDPRHLAYILATARGEVGSALQPIPEVGRGKGKPYGRPASNGKTYYGRGFVQLTWQRNYQAMAALLGVDLVGNPELALDPAIAARIIVCGMKSGAFTGKSLSTYIAGSTCDFVNARRIVNGTDRAQEFAGFAATYLAAIQPAILSETAGEVKEASATVVLTKFAPQTTPQEQEPLPKTPQRPVGATEIIIGLVSAALAAAFGWVFMGGGR